MSQNYFKVSLNNALLELFQENEIIFDTSELQGDF